MNIDDYVIWRNHGTICRGRVLLPRSDGSAKIRMEGGNEIVNVRMDRLIKSAPVTPQVGNSLLDSIVFKRQQETSPLPKPEKDMAIVETKSRALEIRAITDSEAQKINSLYIPAGGDLVSPSNTVVWPSIVTDNLVNRGLARWPVESLQAQRKYLKGIPYKLDHDWDSVMGNFGRTFDTWLSSSDSAPAEVLDRAGMGRINRKIVEREGFHQVGVLTYIDANHPVLDGIRKGIYSEVSMGGFAFNDFVCPICNTSFTDASCPHGLPGPMQRSPYAKLYFSKEELDMFAPYYERVGVSDIGEISLVSIPNLPAVGSIR